MSSQEIKAEIESRKRQVVEQYGEWTAHNFSLGHDVYTLGGDQPYHKIKRFVQVAADIVREPFSNLRVLDLACLEGGFAIEFARQGATVLGIEAREANLAKALFAKDVLQLDRLEFQQGDVRDLSPDRHGLFDIVICAGILYHLDRPDLFRFVKQISAVCKCVAIFDTSFSLRPAISSHFEQQTYWGNEFPEHDDAASEKDRIGNLWGSVGNDFSFWLTKPSLLNLLQHQGFTSVMEVLNPSLVGQLSDRIVLAAIKNAPVSIHATHSTNLHGPVDWPEEKPSVHDPMQRRLYRLEKRMTHLVPVSLRRIAKSALRKVGLVRGNAPWNWQSPWKSQ